MKIFVAGATGAVGKSLVPQLVEAGHQVSAITRSKEKLGTLYELVHLQYRFRVVSYSSGHENSDLCTFAFEKGA